MGDRVQEEDGLVLGAVAEADVGAFSHVLGRGHGTRVLGAIWLGGGRGVGIEQDEGVGREARRGQRDVEAAREVRREVRVGLEMCW